MKILPSQFSTIDQVTGQYKRQSVTATNSKAEINSSFLEILKEKEDEQVKFSKHATQRLSNRNINLTIQHRPRAKSRVTLRHRFSTPYQTHRMCSTLRIRSRSSTLRLMVR